MPETVLSSISRLCNSLIFYVDVSLTFSCGDGITVLKGRLLLLSQPKPPFYDMLTSFSEVRLPFNDTVASFWDEVLHIGSTEAAFGSIWEAVLFTGANEDDLFSVFWWLSGGTFALISETSIFMTAGSAGCWFCRQYAQHKHIFRNYARVIWIDTADFDPNNHIR